MSSNPSPSVPPTNGEKNLREMCKKIDRPFEKVLTWDEENLRIELKKQGFTGVDAEDAVDYWQSRKGQASSSSGTSSAEQQAQQPLNIVSEDDANEPMFTDTFRCEIIPNSVALHHREDVLLYKIQADAALSFYIGVLEVQQKVDWIASFSRMNSPPKQVLVVDGHVKSGKTTTARYIVPWCASRTNFFKAARVIYLELSPLADARGKDFKERSMCEMVITALRSHRVVLRDCQNISSLGDALRLLQRRRVCHLNAQHAVG